MSLLPLAEWRRLFSTDSRFVEVGVQVRVHQEGETEEDGEVQVEVEKEVEENQGGQHMCDMA